MLMILRAYGECGINTCRLLNSSRDISKKECVKERVAAVDYVDRYNVSDISMAISKLEITKSPGADMVCSEHFIYASDKLHVMLTMLRNSMLCNNEMSKIAKSHQMTLQIIGYIIGQNGAVIIDSCNAYFWSSYISHLACSVFWRSLTIIWNTSFPTQFNSSELHISMHYIHSHRTCWSRISLISHKRACRNCGQPSLYYFLKQSHGTQTIATQ